MYVCMCVCVYVCMNVCMHVCMYVCMCFYACSYTYKPVHISLKRLKRIYSVTTYNYIRVNVWHWIPAHVRAHIEILSFCSFNANFLVVLPQFATRLNQAPHQFHDQHILVQALENQKGWQHSRTYSLFERQCRKTTRNDSCVPANQLTSQISTELPYGNQKWATPFCMISKRSTNWYEFRICHYWVGLWEGTWNFHQSQGSPRLPSPRGLRRIRPLPCLHPRSDARRHASNTYNFDCKRLMIWGYSNEA